MEKYHCTVDLLFDWFGISCMTTDIFLQNRLIQTSQTGGQWYSHTSPLVFPVTSTITTSQSAKTQETMEASISYFLQSLEVCEKVEMIQETVGFLQGTLTKGAGSVQLTTLFN
jgi:hypothetical protein